LMANNTTKRLKDIVPGGRVLTYRSDLDCFCVGTVVRRWAAVSPQLTDMVLLDGRKIACVPGAEICLNGLVDDEPFMRADDFELTDHVYDPAELAFNIIATSQNVATSKAMMRAYRHNRNDKISDAAVRNMRREAKQWCSVVHGGARWHG
jgi:hypothetical protein